MIMRVLTWKKTEPPDFKLVPEKAGIYIISTRQETDHEYEVKYVGKASNLRARVTEHWSKNEKNAELKAHIAEKYIMKFNYSEVESEAEREGMELYMYNIYHPPFNHSRPSGDEVVMCTLPAVRKPT